MLYPGYMLCKLCISPSNLNVSFHNTKEYFKPSQNLNLFVVKIMPNYFKEFVIQRNYKTLAYHKLKTEYNSCK